MHISVGDENQQQFWTKSIAISEKIRKIKCLLVEFDRCINFGGKEGLC